MSAIRPALETLSELDAGNFMDKLAVAIHDATSGVTTMGKKSTISITIEVAPMTKAHTVEPVITMTAEIVTKLPKPDAYQALFYVDGEGNPTTKQQRQSAPFLGRR